MIFDKAVIDLIAGEYLEAGEMITVRDGRAYAIDREPCSACGASAKSYLVRENRIQLRTWLCDVHRPPVEVMGPGLDDIVSHARITSMQLASAAIKRLIMTMGEDGVRSRVVQADVRGVLGNDLELRVDGEPVWRASWKQTGEYVFEQDARWLVDPERFAPSAG